MLLVTSTFEAQFGEFPYNTVITDKQDRDQGVLLHFAPLKEMSIPFQLFRDKVSGVVFLSIGSKMLPYESDWEVFYSG